jgi:exonuclease SbcC
MPSSPDPTAKENRLRQFLENAFPGADSKLLSAENAPSPFLVLQLEHQIAGFALANGDPRSTYERAYPFFKALYDQNQRQWDELNLSFVLCLSRRDRELESFCATIETDVFFCRKFAIALDGNWEVELARLPFFPLERRAGAFRRPPSAQALLKSCRVPAALAAGIVGRVGEETILNDCVAGRYGEPALSPINAPNEPAPADEESEPIRLQRLEIENFRAYRKRQSFDLDANLIVLYGPNGFGKTSFFDAIDFAATGDIGRLKLTRNEGRFAKAARHLDADFEPGVVTLTTRTADRIDVLRRSVEERNNPTLNSEIINRKQALLAISGQRVSPSVEHVEHLVRLFRATHLFSQEFQTLTENFQEASSLPAEDVSRMLAFEDYVTAGRKVDKVIDVTGRRVAAGDRRRDEINEMLGRDRAELSRLRESARSGESPEAVAALGVEVRNKLKVFGMEESGDRDAVAEARGWRAVLEARISDGRALISRLSECAALAPIVVQQRAELAEQQKNQVEAKAKVDEATKQARDAAEAIGNRQRELAVLVERERALQGKTRGVAWLSGAKPAFDSLITRSGTLYAEIGELNKSVAGQSEAELGLARIFNEAVAALGRTGEDREANRRQIALMSDLAGRYSQWQEDVNRRSQLEENSRRSGALIISVQEELRDAIQESDKATQAMQRAREIVTRNERLQSDLQNLLGALEAFVTSGHCPACGAFFESKDDLLERLRGQRGVSDSAQEARVRAQRAQEISEQWKGRVGIIRTREKEAQETTGVIAARLENVVVKISNFEKLVSEIGFNLTDVSIASQIQEQLKAMQDVNEQLGRQAANQQEAQENARTALAAMRTQVLVRQEEEKLKRRSLDEVNGYIEAFRSDAERMQVSLESNLEEIREMEGSIQRELE